MKHIVLLDKVKGIGPKTKIKLNKNKIFSTYDLINTFPKNYHVFKLSLPSKDLHKKEITIKGEVTSNIEINKYSKVPIASFTLLNDELNTFKIIAFNQMYLNTSIKQGETIYVKGIFDYYKKQVVLNKFTKLDNYKELEPIYKVDDVSDRTLTKIVNEIFNNNQVSIFETLPNKIINNYNLLDRYHAYKTIHLPLSIKSLKRAIETFKYEEAYAFQKKMLENINKKKSREPKKYNLDIIKQFISTLDYELTIDQKKAVNDIFTDFKKDEVAYRLIQGDVGSGKTIVAAIAILGAVTANEQVALMAPTEMLAKQHYETMSNLFKNFNIRTELLTSSTKNKEEIKTKLSLNQIDLIIGTNALVQETTIFNNLGLIIIDEQHKFGVSTRNELLSKSVNGDLIYLTATPIPRTLAISFFGDADISVIKSKPLGRKQIITNHILDNDLNIVFNDINKRIENKEKVYIVVPAIDSLHAKYNIENVTELIKENIKTTNNIFSLHSKIKKEDQENIIESFISSDTAILIATTMIEVGIDVSNATLMIIFAANYFGLSQLHQLRGRVGRSSLESKCYLISENIDQERLSVMENTSDGFELSEYDLKVRGPGSLLGYEQSGINNFKYLNFFDDYEILKNMRIEILKKQN